MRKDVIYAAVKNRTVTLFMVVLVALMGLYSYYIMPRQEMPDVSAPVAKITAIYPGASPEEVEKLITRKVEDQLPGIEGYDYCQSYSKNGISITILFLKNDADIDRSWDELRTRMDDLQPQLPDSAQKIQVDTNLIDTAGLIISISGNGYSYEQLASYAEDFKKELSRVDGISRVDVVGELGEEVRVEVDVEKLNQYKLSLEDLVNTLKAQNIEIPSGAIEDGESKINVKTEGKFTSLRDIENTIVAVSKETGAVARLRDIADVTMEIEDSAYKIKQNGENAVLVTGYFEENKNIVLVGKELQNRLDELQKNLPSDVKVEKVSDQPKDVDTSVKNFITNLLEGVLFVLIVVFIGMGSRNAAVVSAVIPITMLITFSVMKVVGIKLHQNSITALIIALGMLVDNAIVVSDAIQVRIDNGEDKLDACLKGTKETAVPILTSTLTTVAVFIPLLMLPGVAGEFLVSIPQICIISLSASFVVALFVTPTLAFMFFKKGKIKEKKSYLRRFFDGLLDAAMRHKVITLVTALSIFLLALRVIPILGLSFFPKADKDILYIDVKAENASDLAKTEKITTEVEHVLSEQKEITTYTTAIGDGLPKFFYSVKNGIQSKDSAQILARFDLKKEKRFSSKEELVDYLQGELNATIAGGNAVVKLLENGEPIEAPVRARISGDNMDELIRVAKEIEIKLRNIEGTTNVGNDITDKEHEYQISMDVDMASSMGVTKADVQKQINIALRGMKSTVFYKDGNEYDILVKSNIQSKEELENLAIKSAVSGNKVALKQIAKISLNPQLPQITKFDRDISVSVTSDVKPGYSSVNIQNKLQQDLVSMDTRNVRINFDGEREQIEKNFGNLGIVAIFSILIIYMIIMIQFGSLVQPLVIMITVPLSLIGSVTGLLIFRDPLSFTALLGIVSLIGVVVNNAIILVDYINTERAKGIPLQEACTEAAGKRFRPVMLTTATTVIGLIPLAFSGSSMFGPMSIALMSGLIVATLLTLVVIPVMFGVVIGFTDQITGRLQKTRVM